jgi:hypothetical protein
MPVDCVRCGGQTPSTRIRSEAGDGDVRQKVGRVKGVLDVVAVVKLNETKRGRSTFG